jgi:hypothetical protein
MEQASIFYNFVDWRPDGNSENIGSICINMYY